MRTDLTGLRVAALAADGFEQVELTEPMDALRDHGAEVDVLAPRDGRIRGMNGMAPGKKVGVDVVLGDADAGAYDALLIPGGLIGPDTLRQDQNALEFVRAMDRAGKPIVVICHGPWLLSSAGLVVRRRLTSWPGIRDDLRNAGAVWSDEPLVRDRNWLSSRGPHDLPAFIPGMLEHFAGAAPVSMISAAAEDEGHAVAAALGLVAGGLLAAAAGYALNRSMRNDGVRRPARARDRVPSPGAGADDDEDGDDYGRDFAGGMPYTSVPGGGPTGRDVRSPAA